MDTLFPQLEVSTPAAKTVGPFAGVALEQGIDRVLDYSIPSRFVSTLQIGHRVKVPLGRGNKLAFGYVVSIHPTTDYPRIKPIGELKDERVLVSPQLMTLARWMSRYYVTPLGIVLDSVIPSAVKKQIGIGYSQIIYSVMSPEKLQETFEGVKSPKRRSILAKLMQLEAGTGIELNRLAGEANVTPATVRKLARLGVIKIVAEVDLPRWTAESPNSNGNEKSITLNEEQQAVFDELKPRVADGGFSVNLLRGVTGSGKTEIYLQCIREVVNVGKQAIVLVPEIALTPQTVRRFTARFDRVAILHSGLSASERHRHWQRISQGDAQVVVGARSAVFAPTPNLGIIVVDEEHESSYKQDTAPRYQARDVAIKRAQLENVPILLGSATPSLETYARVTAEITTHHAPSTTENYHLLTMDNRVRGLQMPRIELIDMRQENKFRRGVHLFSQRLEHLLRATIDGGHQAILLLNRRGYSNFIYCASCSEPIKCKFCDATMTYHRSAGAHAKSGKLEEGVHTGQMHCHYCLAVNKLPDKCPTCSKNLSLFGLGTQRVEEEIAKKFPDLKFARVDSDSMHSAKDYEALLAKFANREIQVMLGTQMIAKGLDYPNVTLVGVISGDTALALPDFRAAERTFQLITQVAGRAGRGDSPGRVVLQTFLPEDPTIQFAIKQDYVSFARSELKSRREVGLPPFARMVRIVIREQEEEKLHKLSEDLATAVNDAVAELGDGVRVKGPMPCAISKIAGYLRNQIVMVHPRAEALQKVLAKVRENKALTKSDRVAVDVDPVSLL